MTKLNRHTGCPKCDSFDIRTADSRHDGPWRMRRKHCWTCNHRWTTYEVPVELLDGMEECLQQIANMRDQTARLATLTEMFGARLRTARACPSNNRGDPSTSSCDSDSTDHGVAVPQRAVVSSL